MAASDQVQLGDADSTQPATTAGTRAFFGDAFIDTRTAGVKYFETVWLANPTNVSSTINVKLDFLDGTSSIIPVTVAATVPYASLFGTLGFNTAGLNIVGQSQSSVAGI